MNESEKSLARLRRQNRRKAFRRRIALMLGILSLLLFLYLGFVYGLWGTGLILAPLGIGLMIGWAIEEGIVRVSQSE